MKTIKLLLPEETYQIALAESRLNGLELGHFLTGFVSDELSKLRQIRVKDKETVNENPADSINFTISQSETLRQVLAVLECVWVEKMPLNKAINYVANKMEKEATTIRDKCTRRLGLSNISSFANLLNKPEDLENFLCTRFSANSEQIRQVIRALFPRDKHDDPSTNQSVSEPNLPSQMELVDAIINFLKKNNGSATKISVEQGIFERYKEIFIHPYAQALVGAQGRHPGIPRWQKNVQFARNVAFQMNLLKSPEEAGRGIWALSSEGWSWVLKQS